MAYLFIWISDTTHGRTSGRATKEGKTVCSCSLLCVHARILVNIKEIVATQNLELISYKSFLLIYYTKFSILTIYILQERHLGDLNKQLKFKVFCFFMDHIPRYYR